MESYKLTNLFTPYSSKRFYVKNRADLWIADLEQKDDEDDLMTIFNIPSGISYAAKINKNYRLIIDELEIAKVTNHEAYDKIWNTWKKVWSMDKLDDFPILKDQEQVASDEELQKLKNKTEIEAIYLWRGSKMKISSIALKLNISKKFVKETIEKYKALAKKQIRQNILRRNTKRSAINGDKLDQIKDFWQSNSNKIIRIKDIKRNIWSNSINSKVPWNSTLSTVLHKKLRMSYKLLKTRHPKVFLPESKRLYIEAALIQSILGSNEYEIVFIDEFQITNRN